MSLRCRLPSIKPAPPSTTAETVDGDERLQPAPATFRRDERVAEERERETGYEERFKSR
jgi:hypothetical protein